MPLQQARSAFSMASPLRMMLTPHSFLAKSTPDVGVPRRGDHALLLEGQVPQAVLHHLPARHTQL